MLLLKLAALPNVKSQKDVRIRIWIDELANLSRIPHLAEILSFIRSKGVAIYLSTQSLEGLKRVYEEYEIKDILNNCSNLFCFSVNDEYTATIISKLIGEQQIEVPLKNSFSTPKVSNIDGINLTHTRSTEYAVLPSEIMALEDLEFYAKLRKSWYKGKLKYTKIKKREDIEFFKMNKALLIKELKGEIGGGNNYAEENNNLSSRSNINPNFKPNFNFNSSNLNSSSNSKLKPESGGGVSLNNNGQAMKESYEASNNAENSKSREGLIGNENKSEAGNEIKTKAINENRVRETNRDTNINANSKTNSTSKTNKISNERLVKDEMETNQTNSKQDSRKEEKDNPLSMIDELID